MKVTDMTNLWVGYNEEEDFRVLICAQDEQEGSGCEKSGNVPKLSSQGESVPATSIRHRQQKKIVGEPHLKTSYLQNIRISSNQA